MSAFSRRAAIQGGASPSWPFTDLWQEPLRCTLSYPGGFLLHFSAHAAGLWRFPPLLSSSHALHALRALPSNALRTPCLPRRASPASALRPLCACTVATRFLGISPGRACTLPSHGDAATHARSGANVVRDGACDTSGRFGDSCLSGSSRLARERSRRGSSWARSPL